MLARREVISAAGPYGSPKLLQLSGIGPAALLASVGVPLVQDLPVGQSVQARPPHPRRGSGRRNAGAYMREYACWSHLCITQATTPTCPDAVGAHSVVT